MLSLPLPVAFHPGTRDFAAAPTTTATVPLEAIPAVAVAVVGVLRSAVVPATREFKARLVPPVRTGGTGSQGGRESQAGMAPLSSRPPLVRVDSAPSVPVPRVHPDSRVGRDRRETGDGGVDPAVVLAEPGLAHLDDPAPQVRQELADAPAQGDPEESLEGRSAVEPDLLGDPDPLDHPDRGDPPEHLVDRAALVAQGLEGHPAIAAILARLESPASPVLAAPTG